MPPRRRSTTASARTSRRDGTCVPGAAGLAGRVLYTHTGVRPLPYQPRGSEGAITRRHLIRAHTRVDGLYSIVGGKLTTHRALAEDVLRELREFWPGLAPSPTRDAAPAGRARSTDRDAMLADIGSQLGSRKLRVSSASTARAQRSLPRRLGPRLNAASRWPGICSALSSSTP